MNIDSIFYLDKLRSILLHLPETREAPCFGTPAFYAGKKLVARMKEDGITLALYTDDREGWMKKNPAVYYFTEHYRNYPMMLVRLAKVKDKELETVLIAAWKMRANKRMLKALEA